MRVGRQRQRWRVLRSPPDQLPGFHRQPGERRLARGVDTIPGTGDLDSEIISLSCPDAASCAAGGYYDNNSGADLPAVVSKR